MIYLFDKDEKLIKIVRKSAVKTALQKYALTTERYVSDRLTAELKGLNADELEQIEYMAIQTMEDAHTFHYFYVAQKFSDELTTLIGVQSGIEELRKSPIYDKRPQNALARDVITDLLAGTNWQARFVGETTPHSTNFYYTSIFDALKKACDVWDLEMQFFVEMNGNRIGARYIDFKQRIGEAVGKRVVYGHNALQILQEVERTNIFTALIGRGKGEETGDGYGRKITFENVVWSTTQGNPVNKPAGQKYLELPLMTREYGIKNADGSMRPKIGFVDFSEEANSEVLIERTYKVLIDAARPQLTLKTSSVYLKGVKVGDTIRVVRHDKKLDYDTRIFEITFNRLNNQSSDIKLGDRIGESNEAKAQKIADKAVEQFVNNEFSNFVQNLPDYLPSADGFNNNWYGAEDPTVQYQGKVLINDIWYKPDPEHEGHKIMLRWSGEVWEEILRTYDSEALRDRIAEEIAQVNTSMQAQSEEHDRQVADILSKTQSVEELANQAKTDAASAMARASQVKTEAIADATAQVATVSQALSTAKTDLQNQVNTVDAKAVKAQTDATALRTDLDLQAGEILEQAQAQTALTNRVTTVETLADGTKTTVAELSKTVNKATGDITSVTNRTKVVEDGLAGVKTNYTQLSQTVNTQTGQIQTINSKTADLQSGIDGVTERFENLQVGGVNLIRALNSNNYSGIREVKEEGVVIRGVDGAGNTLKALYKAKTSSGDHVFSYAMKEGSSHRVLIHIYDENEKEIENKSIPGWAWNVYYKGYFKQVNNNDYAVFNAPSETRYITGVVVPPWFGNPIPYSTLLWMKLEKGNIPTGWSPAPEDLRSEIAEYKRTTDQNYAGLQSTVGTLDGKVTQNKTEAIQTATQLSNRLTSVESYKDGEATRAQSYFEASKTETAKQLTAERTAISANYVAKSVYDEDARGTTQKLTEIKTTADTAKQNLATYQNTVDRKLTELTTSAQTLDGKINTASAKVDTVAGQIRTEISAVEGKIPTSVGGVNQISLTGALNGYRLGVAGENNPDSLHTLTKFIQVKYSNYVLSYDGELDSNPNYYYSLAWYSSPDISGFISRPTGPARQTDLINGMKLTPPANATYLRVSFPTNFYKVVLNGGTVKSNWSQSPEDINDELSSVKTTITQTASGVEQLSTSLSTTNNKVTTAETKISQLISDVSSKVSQTDYNTLTGRMSGAETAITQNATEISKRLTSTQVESAITGKGYQTASQVNTAITGKGYQTKGDVDSNITGRGYITNSALQPYALATTVQNLVNETADSFSRTISETKALIPTFVGGRNYLLNSNVEISSTGSWVSKTFKLSSDLLSNLSKIKTVTISCDVEGSNVTDFNNRKRYGLALTVEINGIVNYWEVWQTVDTTKKRISQTHTVPEGKTITKLYSPALWIQATGDIKVSNPKIEYGTLATDYTVALEDLATVTALHAVNDTVDSHTRTIGAVGTAGSILDNVSKVTQTAAGLVQEVSGSNGLKTQVSTLAGSYAIKNLTKAGDVLGQINLNPDGSVRINEGLISVGTKTYIQDGVITSAKIAGLDAGKITTGTLDAARIKANSIDGSKLVFDQAFFNGLTANEAYLKQLFAKNAFITSVQAVAISASNITTGILRATNGAMDVNLNNASMVFRQDAKIEFQSENNTLFRTRNGTSAFIHFRDDAYNGVYTAMGVNADNTGTQNDYSSGLFAGVRVIRTNPNRYSGTAVDQVQIIADEVRFRDAYGYDRDYLTIIWDQGSRIDLVQWMRQFNTNFKHLVNITGRGDVIKTF
ncbi:TPA: phage tail spike protein [Streptococcus suis]